MRIKFFACLWYLIIYPLFKAMPRQSHQHFDTKCLIKICTVLTI